MPQQSLMFAFKTFGISLRSACRTSLTPALSALRPAALQLRRFSQTCVPHNPQSREPGSSKRPPVPQQQPQSSGEPVDLNIGSPTDGGQDAPEEVIERLQQQLEQFSKIKVNYLRPAIWAIVVSSGIYVGLSYFEAKRELKTKPASAGGWIQVPRWYAPRQSPPTPAEVVAGAWNNLNSMSKLSFGIIGVNTGIHLSSFLFPRSWDLLWHLPARNVNYTQFTSMFVHSGALHFFFNMYFLHNFMTPVGYSRLFEGSPYHTLSFFLSAGVLSGYAQHLSTLIPIQKHPIPEILIRCGGASGALFGILGIF